MVPPSHPPFTPSSVAPNVDFPEGLLETPAGLDYSIKCSSIGEPVASLIIISRNGVEVANTTSSDELTHTIENPTLSDTGNVYLCYAENAIGNGARTFTLEVEGE